MTKILMLIIGCSLIVVGCDKKPSEEVGYGTISKGAYSNSYFNMSLKVPENWIVQSEAANKELMSLGGDIISGDNDNLKATIKASEKQSVNMFSFFKYELGAPVSFNPSIIAVAEKVAIMPGIKRGSDYHFHLKKLLKSGKIKYNFPGNIYTKTISGMSFDVMPAKVDVANTTVHQEYYATRIEDYMLLFVLSYTSDTELNELSDIVNSIKFSKSTH